MIIYHIDKGETNDSTILSKKRSRNLKRKTAPIVLTNQSPQITQIHEKCLQATLSNAVLHITRIKQSAGILGWKAGCPCSQVPDRQTSRQNAEKK